MFLYVSPPILITQNQGFNDSLAPNDHENYSYHNWIELHGSTGLIGNRTLNRSDKHILSKIQVNNIEPKKSGRIFIIPDDILPKKIRKIRRYFTIWILIFL